MAAPDTIPEEVIEQEDEETIARRMIANFMNLPKKEREAKMAVVLERGIINDRLTVPGVPEDLHYEWVRNDPMEVDRLRSIGFWIDNKYATKRALHSDGTSSNIVGDVICMMTTKQNKELIDRVRLERSINSTSKKKEDRVFAEDVQKETGDIIPTFTEGSESRATLEDVRRAVDAADNQTRN